MAEWQHQALILPLLTLHLYWLFPHASFGSSVKCWWYRASSDSHSVSIECQVDPQGSMLECGLCHVYAEDVLRTKCSHTNANFRALLDEREIQNTDFTLHCPGRTTLPCSLQKGYPPPTCLIPNDDIGRNIHCHWRALFDPLIPTKFTLHWRVNNWPNRSKDFNESDSGIIERDSYESHELITVWVTASNRLGTVNSELLITNTNRIFQPAPPSISLVYYEPLEITWIVEDETEQYGQQKCKVQYKTQCEKNWTEANDTYEVNFILEFPVAYTTYKFRVRCWHDSDKQPVMSDWSSEFAYRTPAAAPIGMLDVWSDCDSTSDDPSCTILWKEMPQKLARGKINNYLLTMKLTNGSVLNLNGSLYTSAEACVHCGLDIPGCSQDQEQSCFHYCHISIPVTEVNIIGVTANTTGGKSSPALVALPRPGLWQPVALEVKGKSQELNISWSVPPRFTASVQEYVVQHKQIGPNSSCVNWMKVHKNQTFVTLRGQLLNYTAYNVSLFAVVNNRSCLLKSAIAYTVEGVPPEVTDFQAVPTSPYSVNLTWTPIPHNKRNGHITQYLVGLHDKVQQGCTTASEPKQVHKVNSTQSSFQMSNLNPDKQYVVWISANTSAGEGNRTTACFTTSSGDISLLLPILIALIVMTLVISSLISMWRFLRSNVTEWFYKIPDPINSSSFKQMSNQFWHSLPLRSASMECGLAISQVEIIPKPEVHPEPLLEMAREEERGKHGQGRAKELQRYGGGEQNNPMASHQTEYSQMIDSSDEDDWDDEPFPSDYEKHFLPCIVEA